MAITLRYSPAKPCKLSEAEPPIRAVNGDMNISEAAETTSPVTKDITTAVEEQTSASKDFPAPRLLDIALPLP